MTKNELEIKLALLEMQVTNLEQQNVKLRSKLESISKISVE